MIRLKRYTSLILLLSGIAIHGFSQNLYDPAHSRQYANFLEQSQQYGLAAMEFERLLFMEPGNKDFQEHLVRAYRLSDQFSLGLKRIDSWYPEQISDEPIIHEYIKLSLLNGSYTNVMETLQKQPVLSIGETRYYQLSGIVLQNDFKAASVFINNNTQEEWPGFRELCDLVNQHEQIKFRKPGTALFLSAIVPGLGKVYSKDWKDGLISFLFVATNAFQAYRGFTKDGINSTYGWIFATMSFGFYTGNLFGSWKSAKNFNLRSEEALYHEIEHSIFDRF